MHRRAFVGVCLTLVLLVAVGMPAVASPAAAAARKPKVTTIPVGLGPVRVATNPQTNTIYVTNSGDGTVSVINGKKNKVVATIPFGVMPQGIATNPQTNTVYAVDPHTNTMAVIDGATNTVTATIPWAAVQRRSRPTHRPTPSTSPMCPTSARARCG
jgi:YVTN family beta-propeller protein